jgi:hypothetical protein
VNPRHFDHPKYKEDGEKKRRIPRTDLASGISVVMFEIHPVHVWPHSPPAQCAKTMPRSENKTTPNRAHFNSISLARACVRAGPRLEERLYPDMGAADADVNDNNVIDPGTLS